MIKYNLSTIAAAFSTMGRLVNAEKPVVFTKLEGLTAVSCTLFKEAVTHTFKDDDGNVILKRLFIVNEDGVTYHFNTAVSPDYRTDPNLPSRIAQAMTIVGRKKREDAAKKKAVKKAELKVEPKTETTESVKVADVVYDERTGDFVQAPQIVQESVQCNDYKNLAHTLDVYSDEELLAELQRRDNARKAAAELARKKALVEEFLAAYDMTMEDLLEIAEVI